MKVNEIRGPWEKSKGFHGSLFISDFFQPIMVTKKY